jgi:type 1 glutamine amidotransferase
MKRHLLAAFLGAVCLCQAADTAAGTRVLVYTRNFVSDGKGYVHENIPYSVEAIRKIGADHGFSVDASEDPAVFTLDNLRRYKAVVFSNSNNEAFSAETQRQAFETYMNTGGGFVGIHSASGSERKWPYFWSVLGGKFVRHPKMQKFVVRVKDTNHPATKDLPTTFEWEDECYYLDNLNPQIRPLLVTDPAKLDDPKKAEYPGDRFGDSLPLAWHHTEGSSRRFYTALGHKKEHYTDPILVKHLTGGILWAIGAEVKK